MDNIELLEAQSLEEVGFGGYATLEVGTCFDLFANSSKKFKEKIIFQHDGAEISGSEYLIMLDAIMAQLPNNRQCVIAVVLPRSVNWIACMTAIMMRGHIYLPVDEEFPDARILEILSETKTAAIVCTSSSYLRLRNLADICNIDSVILADDCSTFKSESDLLSGAASEDVAYILFTSGSTGKPKGAMIEHVGMLNHIREKIITLKIVESDIIAQVAPVSFDVSIWQALTGSLLGAKTVVYDRDVQLIPTNFLRKIINDNVSILEIVPSYLSSLLQVLERRKGSFENLKLRILVVTGEGLKSELVRRWLAIFPSIPILNAYGPTEASDDITHYLISDATMLEDGYVSLGRPINNTHIHILDESEENVPLGEKGEICVSGLCVGRGYVNNLEMTEKSFRFNHHLAQWCNGRLYKTGDIGYWNKKGDLVFVGRKDEQIKVRGMRVEIGEVENIIMRIAGIEDAAIVTYNNRLVCFFCGDILNKNLKEKLLSLIPAYMLPDEFICLQDFPLNKSGKIDKKELIEFYRSMS